MYTGKISHLGTFLIALHLLHCTSKDALFCVTEKDEETSLFSLAVLL